jgi:hypothetical protein
LIYDGVLLEKSELKQSIILLKSQIVIPPINRDFQLVLKSKAGSVDVVNYCQNTNEKILVTLSMVLNL